MKVYLVNGEELNDIAEMVIKNVINWTSNVSEDLKKRPAEDVEKKTEKKSKYLLDQDQLKRVISMLCSHLKLRCNNHLVAGAAGLSNNTVHNFRLANKFC